MKRVPVIDGDERVRFVDAPRRCHMPLAVRVDYDGQTWAEHVTLVLDKSGLDRVETLAAP